MINNLLDFTDIFNQIRVDERQNIIEHLQGMKIKEEMKAAIIHAIEQLPLGATNEPATD